MAFDAAAVDGPKFAEFPNKPEKDGDDGCERKIDHGGSLGKGRAQEIVVNRFGGLIVVRNLGS